MPPTATAEIIGSNKTTKIGPDCSIMCLMVETPGQPGHTSIEVRLRRNSGHGFVLTPVENQCQVMESDSKEPPTFVGIPDEIPKDGFEDFILAAEHLLLGKEVCLKGHGHFLEQVLSLNAGRISRPIGGGYGHRH